MGAGKLERVARCSTARPGRAISEHRSLAEIALRVRAVWCACCRRCGCTGSGRKPSEVWLALPSNVPAPRIDQPALRAIRMSGPALTEGMEHLLIDGVQVPVFNAAKTVADCFKYRNKIGLDVALEALHDGWAQRKLTMDALCAATRASIRSPM